MYVARSDEGAARRGRPPGYSTEAIADAAIAIADEGGLDAVSMRKVAAALGAGTMSLYRYVDSKECLFELMAHRALGREQWPELTGDWRVDLRDLARGQRALVLAHPWLPRLSSGSPAALWGLERVMSVVDGLGLDLAEMLDVVVLLDSWVNGYARRELDTAEIRRAAGGEEKLREALGQRFAPMVGSGDYPYFNKIIAAEAEMFDTDDDTRFERALDRLMAGLEATLPAPGKSES